MPVEIQWLGHASFRIAGSESDARQFVSEADCQGVLLQPGQAMVI